MKLLYTGARAHEAQQIAANKSLGGFVSSTPIQNDIPNTIFSDLSLFSLQSRPDRETRLIALKNVLPETAIALTFKFELGLNSKCKYSFAIVSPTMTASGPVFERIDLEKAKPFYADFNPIIHNQNYLIAPTFQPNSYLGVWLVRELDQNLILPKDCAVLYDEHKNEEKIDKNEAFKLKIMWERESSISFSGSQSNSQS